MNTNIITDEDIAAKAYDILERKAALGQAAFTSEDFKEAREEALEELLSEDETNNSKGAARAAFVAQSRDLRTASPEILAADYAEHGNAWPFSGDHLDTYDVREEVYTEGVGYEPGDIIGRERRVSFIPDLWLTVLAA